MRIRPIDLVDVLVYLVVLGVFIQRPQRGRSSATETPQLEMPQFVAQGAGRRHFVAIQ